MKRFEFGKLALAATLALSIFSPAPARAEFQMLDDGTGTKQVVHDGSAVYALKDNGNIWMYAQGRWQQLDNGSGTRQIAAAGGRVYAMKDDGRVFRLSFGQWSPIGYKGSRQIAAAGTDLYTLENNDDIFMFWHGDGQWRKVDNGTRTTMISGDDQRGLFVLKNSGQIFHHLGNGQFELTDDGAGTNQIDSAGGVLYALKANGNIWRNNGQWQQVDDGQNTLQVAADGMNCSILKGDRSVFVRRNEQWARANTPPDVKALAARADEVVALRQNGNILIARNGNIMSDIRVQRFQQLYDADHKE